MGLLDFFRRKKKLPTLKDLIEDKLITLDMAKDWLRSIYEIRFFEEKAHKVIPSSSLKIYPQPQEVWHYDARR